jgi:hypothetical protein
MLEDECGATVESKLYNGDKTRKKKESERKEQPLDQDEVKGKSAREIRGQISVLGALKELSITALIAVLIIVRADKGLLEHEALAGISAGHHVDGATASKSWGLLPLLVIVVSEVHEGVGGAALLFDIHHREHGIDGHGWGRGQDGIDACVEVIERDDGGSGSCTDRARIDGLCIGVDRSGARAALVRDGDALSDEAGDVREDRGGWGREIGSELGGLDVGDEKGQELLLGGREWRCEEKRLAV